jgi:hypothetical protein
MQNLIPKTLVLGLAVCGSLVVLPRGFAQAFDEMFLLTRTPDPDPGSKHFRVGALVGFNLKAEFSTSGNFAFSGQNPGATGTPGGDHFYDDGYVRVDATGNDPDATYFWGYQNAAQYDGNANRLTFHSTDSYTTASSGSTTADPQVGFDTAYGGHLFRVGSALVGWEFGFGFLPIKIEDQLSGAVTVNRTVHWYDTSNLGEAFFGPANNPLGSYDGSVAGPGAKLSDIANSAPGDTAAGTLTGTRTLDVTLYNFRLGPTVHWELSQRIAVALSAGGAMGFITGDLDYNEQLVLTGSSPINRGSFSDSDIVYGGYIAGMLMFHAEDHGDFYLGVQYMPMSSATFSGGGREATLNMSGAVYISAGINWPF